MLYKLYSTLFVIQYFLWYSTLFVFLMRIFINCICHTCTFILRVFFILFVSVIPYVYLLYNVFIAVLTLDAELLARSQYPKDPTTCQLDTGVSWFPCVYKRMGRWFPNIKVAITCFSFSTPDLNFLVTFFILAYM